MTIVNHECYVSLEVAKLLKEAGFDWKVRYMYRNNNPILHICTETSYRNTPKPNKCPMYWQYAAPALEVAQRWLREVKGWEVQVAYGFDEDGHKTYVTECGNPKGDLENYIVYFSTYEQALEACIKKALELILEKGE